MTPEFFRHDVEKATVFGDPKTACGAWRSRMMDRSDFGPEHNLSHDKKHPGTCLGIIRDYSTQLCGDCT